MPLERVLAATIVAGLVIYVIGGGADFGGGMWDLLASGPRRDAQRALIERTIGPIWEANHVWFIFVFVLLFSAFPPAFAAMTTALFTPLTLYALGLVLRGSAFTFRHYDAEPRRRRRFGALFSAVSIGCPFLLGGEGAALVRERPLSFELDLFVLSSGLFVLALVAALAATYLTLEAGDEALREDFRRRALGGLAVAGLSAWAVLASAGEVAPELVRRVGRGGGHARARRDGAGGVGLGRGEGRGVGVAWVHAQHQRSTPCNARGAARDVSPWPPGGGPVARAALRRLCAAAALSAARTRPSCLTRQRAGPQHGSALGVDSQRRDR